MSYFDYDALLRDRNETCNYDDAIPEEYAWTKIAAEMIEDISGIILEKRLELGLTQEQMAEKFGISQGMLSRYERGLYNITIKKLAQMLTRLDIEVQISKKESVANDLMNPPSLFSDALPEPESDKKQFDEQIASLEVAA